MYPSQLTPGLRVLITVLGSRSKYHGEFIRRTPAEHSKSGQAVNVFIVNEFAGITGPDDVGDVHLSDESVYQRVKPMGAH